MQCALTSSSSIQHAIDHSQEGIYKNLHQFLKKGPPQLFPDFSVHDIGVWFDVMQGMVLLAILTNCLILVFSSEQWLPWLYSRDPSSGGDQVMAIGSGRFVKAN